MVNFFDTYCSHLDHCHAMNSSKDKLVHDVVIIGGGVIGLTIARALALRGVRDICVLERAVSGHREHHSRLAECSRHRPKPTHVTNSSTSFGEVATSTPTSLQHLKEESGIDIELDTTGTLYLAFTEHDQIEIDATLSNGKRRRVCRLKN